METAIIWVVAIAIIVLFVVFTWKKKSGNGDYGDGRDNGWDDGDDDKVWVKAHLPVSTMGEARAAPHRMALKKLGPYWYWDCKRLNLATSSQSVVEIRRDGGWGLLISPTNSDMFLEQLIQAIDHDRSFSGLLVSGYRCLPVHFRCGMMN